VASRKDKQRDKHPMQDGIRGIIVMPASKIEL